MERNMRRIRQLLSQEETVRILESGKVAVWAVAGDDGYPYAVPINYVYHAGCIYVHCARQGHKLDAIRRNPKCSMCIVDKDDVVADEFTSYFRSVIAFGIAEVVEELTEIIEALKWLSCKYCPGIDPSDEIQKFINNVCIVRIRLTEITGKEAIELVRMRTMSIPNKNSAK
ncbi:MAG: pyridoxamine 5'-phosphate oxidase family protein [Muribaculaceae bacterium]|nr:pyridoxamine 5'-phosphate oxidase family protein [Muribaculaceae bacterium]